MTEYDPRMALEIVERIADGELLANITAADAEPLTVTKQTFLQWVATVPELRKAYSAARKMSAQTFEEKAIDVAEKLAKNGGGKDKIAAANTLISQYRWSATRRDPTNYSDKGDTKIVVPININTTLDMGQGSAAEVEDQSVYNLSLKAEKVEDAEFREISDADSDPVDDPIPNTEDDSERNKFLSDLIQADTPSNGTERQPILEAQKKKRGAPIGPRKRVLTPRIQQ